MSHPRPVCSRCECIALLLQGGGALGAYQAGVYQALSEARLQPNWVAGISIGAINAAFIAGNAPLSKRGPAGVVATTPRPHRAGPTLMSSGS
jgi:predicted acylesterase/phospholipase RssA